MYDKKRFLLLLVFCFFLSCSCRTIPSNQTGGVDQVRDDLSEVAGIQQDIADTSTDIESTVSGLGETISDVGITIKDINATVEQSSSGSDEFESIIQRVRERETIGDPKAKNRTDEDGGEIMGT